MTNEYVGTAKAEIATPRITAANDLDNFLGDIVERLNDVTIGLQDRLQCILYAETLPTCNNVPVLEDPPKCYPPLFASYEAKLTAISARIKQLNNILHNLEV